MRFGIVFPQTEIGNDPAAIRDYAQAAESLGYSHILAYDHILGAGTTRSKPLNGPYTHEDPFHEPFLLYSFMAAVTSKIEFTTGILVLPQRETALVAKQAATLDILCQGRQRLGLGVGWNWVEYEALNQDFQTRGRRIEEQVKVLRQLWTQPLVNFDGEWHHIPNAGINPLPIQRPIPLWFGGHADAVLWRVAEMGDGWMLTYQKAADARPSLDKISANLATVGRDWEDIGIEVPLRYGDGNPDRWISFVDEWRASGATHLSINTMRCGFDTPDEHLKAIQRFAEISGLFPL